MAFAMACQPLLLDPSGVVPSTRFGRIRANTPIGGMLAEPAASFAAAAALIVKHSPGGVGNPPFKLALDDTLAVPPPPRRW